MIKKLFSTILLGFVILIASNSHSQSEGELTATYEKVFRSENTGMIGTHFNSTIELSTPGKEGRFSNKQARLILDSFFKKNKVKRFDLTRNGDFSDGSRFFLGEMQSTSEETFRVYFVIRETNGKWLIHILKFTKS